MIKINDLVVYVDDFMPDTLETVTSINDGYLYFNQGSRSCIIDMTRLALNEEKKSGCRINN